MGAEESLTANEVEHWNSARLDRNSVRVFGASLYDPAKFPRLSPCTLMLSVENELPGPGPSPSLG